VRVRAITLDLDDTLWPIEPVMLRAEQRLDSWLRAHCPPVADQYPIAAMRALRDEVAAANPDLAHDFTTQRLLCLRSALSRTAMARRMSTGLRRILRRAQRGRMLRRRVPRSSAWPRAFRS
jgi:hypothetical protein